MKIMMLSGMPGSGKSTFAEELAKKEKATLVSTDTIRENLLGSASRQKKTGEIYREVERQIEKAITNRENVIFDATNIERERREKFIAKYQRKDRSLVCYVFDTPWELCIERNNHRTRKVWEERLKRYWIHFQVPVKGEGWDEVHVVHTSHKYPIERKQWEEIVAKTWNQKELFEKLSFLPFFRDMVGCDQKNPYHQRTLDAHTYGVYESMELLFEEKDLPQLRSAALFHDVGKLYTQVFKENRQGTASYFGHENVSALLALHFFTELGFSMEFINEVVSLIAFHMEILHGGEEGERHIYHCLGDELLWKLYEFRQADEAAKEL